MMEGNPEGEGRREEFVRRRKQNKGSSWREGQTACALEERAKTPAKGIFNLSSDPFGCSASAFVGQLGPIFGKGTPKVG